MCVQVQCVGGIVTNVHGEEGGICGYTGQYGWMNRLLNEGKADARMKIEIIKQGLVTVGLQKCELK